MNKYCYRRVAHRSRPDLYNNNGSRSGSRNPGSQLTSGQHGVWVTAGLWLSASKGNNKICVGKQIERHAKLRGKATKQKARQTENIINPRKSHCVIVRKPSSSAVGSFGQDLQSHVCSHCQPLELPTGMKWWLIRAFSRS